MSDVVLLIDDTESLHPLVSTHLKRDGLEVVGARNGMEGIDLAKRVRPDVILLDVSMPDMDGFEVCELLSVQPETSNIPVMFLTASDDAADRVRGLSIGASDYIAKPFNGEELRARVRVSLRYKALLDMESRRAMRDGLTGLWNRKYLDQRLASESAASIRYSRPLSCVMFDLDHFKLLNDSFGHSVGDRAIQQFADILQASCRKEDIACRYGGEEFALLCPNVTATGAMVVAERIRRSMESRPIEIPGGVKSVNCSAGAADGFTDQDLLKAADSALYHAKRSGRNRVCNFEPTMLIHRAA